MNEDLKIPKSITIAAEVMKPGVNKNGTQYTSANRKDRSASQS